MVKYEQKEINHRFGNYFRRTATMKIEGRKYRVNQRAGAEDSPLHEAWETNKRTMINLLRKYPDYWCWKRFQEFDGMSDCVNSVKMDWTPLSEEQMERLIWEIDGIPHRIEYHTRGDYFECYSLAVGGFKLKFGGDLEIL